jgi:GNAT superfamily N-acetyltransferase
MPSTQLVPSRNSNLLLPLLRDAEEGDDRITRAIEDPVMTAYIARSGDTNVGAVVMHWAQAESEIIYMATELSLRGQGYGKAMIAAILDEARLRGVQAICVGTANGGLDNIAFYQKCGFRMDSVRKDYFDYFAALVYENGIQIRDMLVLKLVVADLGDDAERS